MNDVLRKDNYLSSVNASHGPAAPVAAWQHGVVPEPSFKENLADFLVRRDINQAELAARVRVDPGAVSRWLKHGHLPGAQDFMAIARVLNLDPWLLIGSSFQEPDPPREVAAPGRRPKDATLTRALAITPKKVVSAAPAAATRRPTRRTKDERE